jgi:hypothetical protein
MYNIPSKTYENINNLQEDAVIKVKYLAIAVFFFGTFFFGTGCKNDNASQGSAVTIEVSGAPGKEETSIRLSPDSVITVGDHSYVPLNLEGNPDKNCRTILKTLDIFKQKNPGLEVISWSIEKQQLAEGAKEFVFGLWINHRQKQGGV